MAALTGQTPSSTYRELLRVEGGVTSTSKQVVDGLGAGTPLYVSSAGVTIDGDLSIESLDVATITVGSLTVTGSAAGIPVHTGNTLWVDAVNGDDNTALPDRADLPYLTPTAAQTAAASGDLVVVRPGSYALTDSILKAGVRWHIQGGAVVTGAAGTAVVNPQTAGTIHIFGEGELRAGTDAPIIVVSGNSGAVTVIEGVTLDGAGSTANVIGGGTGRLTLRHLTIEPPASGYLIDMDGVSGTVTLVMDGVDILGGYNGAMGSIGAGVVVDMYRTRFVGGGGDEGLIVGHADAELSLTDCVFDVSAYASGSPLEVYSDNVTLTNCVLRAGSAANAIDAPTASHTVTVRGSLDTNRPNHANVTLTGGPAVRSDESRTLIDLLNPLALPEVAVTGATAATVGRMHVCSGTTSDYTVSLPAAGGNAGKLVGLRMAAGLTRLVTIDGNSSETIDGATTRVMWAGEAAVLLCDGSNWFKVAGKTVPMICRMRRNSDESITSGTIQQVHLNATDLDTTGRMADTTNNRINVVRPGKYAVSGGVRYGNLTADAVRLAGFSVKNTPLTGTQYAFSEVSASAGAYPYVVGYDVVDLVAGDYMVLATFHNTGASETADGDAASQSPSLQLQEIPLW